jgi:hypothetical protein
VLTFERGGFLGIIIGDEEDIGRRPDVIPPPAAVSFSICKIKIMFNDKKFKKKTKVLFFFT